MRVGIVASGMIVSFLVATSAITSALASDSYGEGAYGACNVQTTCTPDPTGTVTPNSSSSPSPTPVPVTVFPVGSLQVSVNIRDGQSVPAGTYRLTVTPLNGQGSTFGSIEWYSNDSLLSRIDPDTTGTATYDWRTPNEAQATLTLKVYTDTAPPQLGSTQSFHITIIKPTPTPEASRLPTAGTSSLPPAIAEIINQAKAALQNIPVPVRTGLPYALLTILACILLLTYMQARQEVYHTQTLMALAARDEQLAANKTTLVQLASHYLRTPVTLLSGGLELGASLHEIPPTTATQIASIVNPLKQVIETNLHQVANLVEPSLPSPATPAKLATRFWLQPQFLAPIVIASLVLATYQWLATDGQSAGASIVNAMTQIAILVTIATALAIWLRRRRISTIEKQRYQAYQARQMDIDESRNRLITGAGRQLASAVGQLETHTATLNQSATSTRQIAAGVQRLKHVAAQFNLAVQLQSGHAADELTDIPLQDFVTNTVEPFQQAYANGARQFSINTQGTAKLRHADWIKFVLTSLLDNATTFTSDGGKISITTSADKGVPAITVSDNGQGMPLGFATSVFQPFAKAEGAINFNHEGMGFSLYLDKLIMEYLGGSITIDSQPGRGTLVKLGLPTI